MLTGAAERTNTNCLDLGRGQVSAIRSTHIPGMLISRRYGSRQCGDGGDAGNDAIAPPRSSSTSEQGEKLAKGVEPSLCIVTPPSMALAMQGLSGPVYYAKAPAIDLGAMASAAGRQAPYAHHYDPPLR